MSTSPTVPSNLDVEAVFDRGGVHPGRYWLGVANDTDDPIAMCGAALCGLLELLTERDEAEGKAERNDELVAELDEEHRELERLHDAKQKLIEDTLLAVKKSTSKLADQVRSILEPVVAPTGATAPLPTVAGVPGKDAPLEVWQAYARSIGHTGTDIDGMNRSQIRTKLGISNGDGA